MTEHTRTYELLLPAEDEKLDELLSFLEEKLAEAGCPPAVLMKINISAEEIFINIAHYAYGPEGGSAALRLEISDDPPAAALTFSDCGTPYDPLSRKDPDLTLPAEERQIGGLGVYMVKKQMDEVSYEYKDGQNVLWMKKAFAPARS